jgi:hypothetical protein
LLFLHQQGLDSTTPAGKAFQMMGVFPEFERAVIRANPCGLDASQERGREARVQALLHFLGVVARIALGGGGSLGRLDQGILELRVEE